VFAPDSTPSERADLSAAELERISARIAGVYADGYGISPTGMKAYALGNVVICVLHGSRYAIEHTLIDAGKGHAVREMRSAFEEAVGKRFTDAVEEIAQSRVVAFMSQAHSDPDLTIEVFFLDHAMPVGKVLETEGNAAPLAPA